VPYPKFTATSESEVRLRLAQDDADAIESGTRQVVHNDVTPGLFVYHGLELEEIQCVLLAMTYSALF
jgi:hypothetical protein